MVRLPISAEEKFREAVFFFNRMIETKKNVYEFPHNFSAFLSAMRSVTLYLQQQFSRDEKFAEWYSSKQAEMRDDPLLKMLKNMRDEVLHARPIEMLVSAGPKLPEEGVVVTDFEVTLDTDANGNIIVCTRFEKDAPLTNSEVVAYWSLDLPEERDVLEVCDTGLRKIRSILDEWRQQGG